MNKVLILFIGGTFLFTSLVPAMTVDTSDYLIAGSHDGNQHDKDDYLATALAMGILGETCLQEKVVHWDYCNHLGDNSTTMENEMITSTEGGASRFGVSQDVIFNCQDELSSAINNFVAVSQLLGPDLRLYYCCAGPMEVPWRMLNAVNNNDSSKLQYIVCISHSNWNENHDDTTQMNHTWNDMINSFPAVRFHRISDQNGCSGDNDFNSPESQWSWLCNSGISNWEWICTRDQKTDFDASDAGMYMYVISGTAATGKNVNRGGPYTGATRYSYCATVQDTQWLFEQYECSGPDPQLIAHYALNGDVTDSANDNDGTNHGASFVTGVEGQAADFDGSSDYIEIPRTISTDFSIAFWVKTTQTAGTGQWWAGNGLIDGEVGGVQDDFGTALVGSKFAFGVGNSDTTILSSSDINTGSWLHVAATRDGASGLMKVYVNGQPENYATGAAGAKTAPPSLHIGSLQTDQKYFDGQMDDVRLYNYVISDQDVEDLYNAGIPDTSPPTPDPMTWATLPHSTGETSIAMTASTASDPSGVEYYFTCTAGGGNDSGWQSSPSYEDTGLTPDTTYTYTVTARDLSPNQNTTAASTAESATTDAPDLTPPTPDPMTWATVPYAVNSTSIAMTAATASDPSGVEYYFDETSGNPGGTDSGWQDSPSYTDSGLTPNTQYTYTVTARDKSAAQNATAASTAESATTPVQTTIELNFGPTDDAYIEGSSGNNNTTLRVEYGNRVSYLKFDVSGIPGGYEVTDADLQLTEGGDTGNGTLRFYRGSHNNWTESNLSPANAPATEDQVGLRSGSVSGGQTISVDVTPLVTGNATYSVVIEMDAGGNDIWFASKETADDPVLTVVAELTQQDTTPPSPDPMTWAQVPTATGTDSISMTATTASDPSGVQYYFTCTAGGGNDSGWQSSPSYEDTGLTPDTTYTYTVTARDLSPNQNQTSASTAESATTNAAGGDLPAPWGSSDIGTPGAAGDASYDSGTFTIDADGADIWGTADAFHYVYQPWDGDVEIIAQVNALANTNNWAKAGVMVRQSLDAGSKHAMMVVTPGNGTSFQRRLVTDDVSYHTTPQDSITAPCWVRILRIGDTLIGYNSTDGINWTEVGSAAVSMSSSVYVGLAVTSHSDGVLTTATVSDVQVNEISNLGLEDFEGFTITEALQGEPMLTYAQAISLGLDAGGWIFTADDSGFAVQSSGGPDGSAYIAREDSSQKWSRGFSWVIRDNYQTTGIQPLEFDFLFQEVGADPANGGGMAVRVTGINPSGSWAGVLDGNGGGGQYGTDFATRYRPEPDPGGGDALAADGTYLLFLSDRLGDFASSSNWQYKAVDVDFGTGYEWIVVHFGHNFQDNGLGVANPHLYFGIDNVAAPFLP